MAYDHRSIENKISKYWEDHKVYQTLDITNNPNSKPKKYILDMFPYPSGAGLHVGHPRGYVGSDILARYYRMQGFNVLHPMGWDSFGLPAENYAKKNKIMPEVLTKANIATFKRQLQSLGLSYDWDRELATTDEEYFRWTQWIFLKMFKKGLAFEDHTMVNWCPALGTILANEEVSDGLSEIGSHPVYRKPLKQWSLRITQYADRLNEDLSQLDKWPEKIRLMQKNWIGKSQGYEVKFDIVGHKSQVEVYTTRLDTIASNTYLILAPEHKLLSEITTPDCKKKIDEYVLQTQLKSDLARQENQEFTGEFTGAYAINPINGDKLPIWIADFVLVNYAKGAVFGDAHDKRDFDLAKKYNIPLKTNIYPKGADESLIESIKSLETCFDDLGVDENGRGSNDLKKIYGDELIAKGYASTKINYRLKDWGFSRQRYWGEPIPVVFEVDENKNVISKPRALDDSQLPLKLPPIDNFDLIDFDTTKEDPEPILNRFEDWLYVKGYYTDCGEVIVLKDGEKSPHNQPILNFKREGNTMPQWAGSSWYFLRFMDTKNSQFMVDPEVEKYWGQVDIYIGGAEHAVLHLLYARFWYKFLFDLGVVSHNEPFASLMNQGLIMADDGRKMSKSIGNVINPDDIIEEYGADTLRCFEMFIGPFDQAVNWSTTSIVGVRRFLDKIDSLKAKISETSNPNLDYITNFTISEVTENLETFKFNSSVARMMEWSNAATKETNIGKNQYLDILKLLSIYAPFLTESIYQELGFKETITQSKWPTFDKSKLIKLETTIAVQINGKVRGEIMVTSDTTQDEALALAKQENNINKYLILEPKKVIYVPSRILNIIL
jgi:leucyl-tRNA synthetase